MPETKLWANYHFEGELAALYKEESLKGEDLMFRIAAALILLANPLWAKGERAGDFDFYLMALSWTPSWCDYEGDRRGSPQCDAGRAFGFTLHGLWPQYDQGWPSFCPTSERPPSKSMTKDMADIMGSAGLAWHQWRKHGVCSGLSAADYFAASRRAYAQINRPAVFRKIDQITTPERPFIDLPLKVVEDAFLDANPTMTADQLLITCKDGRVQEVRICLSKDLEPTDCAIGRNFGSGKALRTGRNNCSGGNFEMAPIR